MARIMNLGKWQKAYMLEFISDTKPATGFNWDNLFSKNDKSEIFTFALPPESEDFDYSQRVTETKTFGGAVFDDYGNDTYKITLSGSTVNNEKKLIYKGNKTLPGYLTGEEEIFKLQELIDKYGKLDNLEGKVVYLYDLSKMSLLQIAANSPSRNWWRVHIKSLKIKRTKDKPFSYNYTLEMIAYKENSKARNALLSNDFMESVQKAQDTLDKINTVMSAVAMAVATCGSIRRGLVSCKELYERFNNNDLSTAEKVKLGYGLAGSTERLLLGTSTVNSLYNGVQSVKKDCDILSNWKIIGKSENEKSGTISNDELFTVTFNANGGHFVIAEEESETFKESISYSHYASKPAEPKRENYEFVCWYLPSEPEIEFDFSENPIKNNTILFAKWLQKKAIVSFNSRGGSAVESQIVDIGSNAMKPANPTRKNYKFFQWCSNYAGTVAFNFNMTTITEDTVIYASWERATAVTVEFDTNGGSPVDSQSVEPGEKIIYPATPTKDDYAFAGWYTDEELTESFDFTNGIDSSFTLYAKWTHAYCNVVFDANGGSLIQSQKIVLGGKISIPEAPVKEGYTFAFWCNDSSATNEFNFNTTVMADTTLYARWERNVYSVNFNTNGGSEIQKQNIRHGELALFPDKPTKQNYSFYKWCSDKYLENEFSFFTPVISPLTLYARWFGATYTFSFNTNGGNEISAQTIQNGKKATEAIPTKAWNIFMGWFADEAFTKKFDFTTPIEHDMTIYAKWKPEQRTVNFNTDGGSDVDAQTVDYGTVITRPANPSRYGSTFAGWFSDVALTRAYDFSMPVTENFTIFAKWS